MWPGSTIPSKCRGCWRWTALHPFAHMAQPDHHSTASRRHVSRRRQPAQRIGALALLAALSCVAPTERTAEELRVSPRDTVLPMGGLVTLRSYVAGSGGVLREIRTAPVRVSPPSTQSASAVLVGPYDGLGVVYGAVAPGVTLIEARLDAARDTARVTVVADTVRGVRALAAAGRSSCVLDGSGDPWCWGESRIRGRRVGAAAPTREWVTPRFSSLLPARNAFCALDVGGAPWCWMASFPHGGTGSATGTGPVPQQPTGGHRFTKLTGSTFLTCGLDSSHLLWCWGEDTFGATGTPEPPAMCGALGVVAPCAPEPVLSGRGVEYAMAAVGEGFTCAIERATADVICFGANRYGQLGRSVATRCSDRFGEQVPCSREPIRVDSLLGATSVAAGGAFACAVDGGSRVWCWGSNTAGQLGRGSFSEQEPPAPVGGGLLFAVVVTGSNHACGLDVEGFAYCWGAADRGQAGPAQQACTVSGITIACAPQPQAVPGGHRFIDLVAGFEHTCGRRADDVVLCWGENYAGQLGTGSFELDYSPVPLEVRYLAPD